MAVTRLVEMVLGILRRVAYTQNVHLLSVVIDGVKNDVGIAHDRQFADAGSPRFAGRYMENQPARSIVRLMVHHHRDARLGGRAVAI